MALATVADVRKHISADGKTLSQRLDELYAQFGCYAEGQLSILMPGEKGMDDMRTLMARLRATPPASLGGLKVVRTRDYLGGQFS